MIKINEHEDITKILDISAKQLSMPAIVLINTISGYEQYRDNNSNLREHIYPFDIIEILADNEIMLDEEIIQILNEIEELCNHYFCAYWRIIDIS